MFEFLQRIAQVAIPIFVVSTMLNVGLTQSLGAILEQLSRWGFVAKMVLANVVLVPLLMIVALRVVSFEPALEAGLLIFALCAGAPFLIKLTQRSGHAVALGVAVMLLLMAVTVLYVPISLPPRPRGGCGRRLGHRPRPAPATDRANRGRHAGGALPGLRNALA